MYSMPSRKAGFVVPILTSPHDLSGLSIIHFKCNNKATIKDANKMAQ